MHPGWHRDAFKRTFKFGSWQTVANIGGTLAHQGVDKIIIGMLLSTAAVGFYNVAFRVVTQIYSIAYTLAQVLFPAISNLQGQKKFNKIKDLVMSSGWILTTLSMIALVPLMVLGGDVLRVWLGQDFAEHSTSVLRIITAAAMFSVNFIVPNFYLLGIGKTTWTAASSLAQGIIMVSANLLLIPILGLVGTGWAFLLGTAVAEVMHVFIWRVSFRTKVSAGVYFSTFLEPSAVGVILGTGLLMLRSSIRWVPNLLEILGWGVACGVLTMLLCILADSILPGGSERRREAIQLAYRLLSRPRRSTREVR